MTVKRDAMLRLPAAPGIDGRRIDDLGIVRRATIGAICLALAGLPLSIVRMHATDGDDLRLHGLGLTVAAYPGGHPLSVESLASVGAARGAGILVGDRIVAADGLAVRSPSDLDRRISHRDVVVLHLVRGRMTMDVVVHLGKEGRDDTQGSADRG